MGEANQGKVATKLSDDQQKVEYGYSFRQAKRALGYTIVQEPSRARIVAEFQALIILIENIQENSALTQDEADLPDLGQLSAATQKEAQEQIQQMQIKLEAERIDRTRLQAELLAKREHFKTLIGRGNEAYEANTQLRTMYEQATAGLKSAIAEYDGVLELGGSATISCWSQMGTLIAAVRRCLPGSGFEKACTIVEELQDNEINQLRDFITQFQEQKREHMPYDLEELRNLVRYLDSETAQLKVRNTC